MGLVLSCLRSVFQCSGCKTNTKDQPTENESVTTFIKQKQDNADGGGNEAGGSGQTKDNQKVMADKDKNKTKAKIYKRNMKHSTSNCVKFTKQDEYFV